jgi:ring-1,2-phenylacetyl-CoA epoxidase subunit PaaC
VNAAALHLGDDALVLSHRLSEWIRHAPELEEDVALANIALDLLGQARALLSSAGDEDELAFLRGPEQFTNLLIVEQPNGDFAQTIARQLLFSTYQHLLYARLSSSADETLAGVAQKAVKETAYHRDHAVQWTLRLGDGTGESHRRMQEGLDRMWPYVEEMLTGVPELRPEWDAYVDGVLAEATLTRRQGILSRAGGRHGRHEHLAELLAELQQLRRAVPAAMW